MVNKKEALKIISALKNDARFVGGCVRDLLLKKDIKDIDIATAFTPQEATKLLKSKGIKVIPTGIKHGTVTAIINDSKFEITTLRKDVETYGRHAKVEFTDDWKEDAKRRDFTINALYMDKNGKIYDYFGGQKDLKNEIVRFIGNPEDRVKEDYLRILRFFRFSSFYAKNIDKNSLSACIKHSGKLKTLSGERIRVEMFKILTSPKAHNVLSVMEEKGILKILIPGKVNLKLFKELKELINENKNLKHCDSDYVLYLAGILFFSLLEDEKIELISKLWKLSNRERDKLHALAILPSEIFGKFDLPEQKKLLRKKGKEDFTCVVLLKWAEELSAANSKKSAIDKKYQNIIKLIKDWKAPEFPVSGKDLINSGIEPGKEFGLLLKKAEKWWEGKGYKPNKKEIIKYIMKSI